jgi:hypothetical protein
MIYYGKSFELRWMKSRGTPIQETFMFTQFTPNFIQFHECIGHLVVTGTWLDYDFPNHIGNRIIIPTDELTPSFFRGIG